MIAIYYLHLFIGNMLVGYLGGLLSRMDAVSFWLLHAAIMGVAAVLLILVRAAFGRLLAPDYGEAHTAA
jgi:POT family proton-dependent oligopeptide transporter